MYVYINNLAGSRYEDLLAYLVYLVSVVCVLLVYIGVYYFFIGGGAAEGIVNNFVNK